MFCPYQHNVQVMTSVEALAAALKSQLPEGDVQTGYLLEEWLFLNDSLGNHTGHVEFAVVRPEAAVQPGVAAEVPGVQVDSWTISWMGTDTIARCIRSLLAGQYGDSRYPVVARLASVTPAPVA